MRNTFFLLLFSLGLGSCQSGGDSHKDNTAIDSFDYEKAGLEITEDQEEEELQLTDLPPQKSAPNTVNFTGNYTLPEEAGYQFTVKLEQKGDSIVGTYCGYTETRSDCGMPSQGSPDCGIKGVIRNNTAYLIFSSCYMAKQGKAILTTLGNNILWNTHLFPENDGGPYFCAAPDSALLLNKELSYDSPATLSAFQASSKNWLTELPEGTERMVFGKTKVLHEPSEPNIKTFIYPGTPFKILSTKGDFGYGRIGDEIFDVPAYEIEFENNGRIITGYIHYHEIALHHFTDSRGNLFLLGLEDEADLVWRVKNTLGEYYTVSAGVKELSENHGVYFPLFQYKVQTLPEVQVGNLSFIQLDFEYRKYQDTQKYSNLFSWDGKELLPVLPLLSKLRPYDIQAKAVGEHLEVSFLTEKDQYSQEKYKQARQTQILSCQEKRFENIPTQQRIALGHLGKQNEFTFPDSLEGLDWHGVRVIGDEVIFEPIVLSIEKEETEDEVNGTWTKKKISSNSEETYDFIISGLPGIDDELNRKIASLSEGEINPGREKSFSWEDCDWTFTATGDWDELGPVKFNLLLTGTRAGNLIEQNLHFSPFREFPVEFTWSGDLDGDELPDFIINVDEKGIMTDKRLYLSSFAKEGHLVGLAGSFYSNMPGC